MCSTTLVKLVVNGPPVDVLCCQLRVMWYNMDAQQIFGVLVVRMMLHEAIIVLCLSYKNCAGKQYTGNNKPTRLFSVNSVLQTCHSYYMKTRE